MEGKIVISKRLLWIAGAVALLVLAVYLLQPVLMPFLLAASFAYLLNPWVGWLEQKRIRDRVIGRTAAVSLVFFVMTLIGTLLCLLIVPLLVRQLTSFVHHLPDYIAWLQEQFIPYLQSVFGARMEGLPVYEMKQVIKQNWQQAGSLITMVIKSATESTVSAMMWMANMILVPVVTFYLLRDWDKLLHKIRELLPRAWENFAVATARECDGMLSAFIRGQLLVMSSLAVVYSIGLGIVGLDLALFLGTLAGFASIVPYLGAILGILLSSIIAYMQFQEFLPVVYVLLVFGVGQILESMFLTPLLVGDKIGLHPVGVIFAIMAGGQLAGFFGILAALPVAAVLMVLMRHLLVKYKASGFYQTNE